MGFVSSDCVTLNVEDKDLTIIFEELRSDASLCTVLVPKDKLVLDGRKGVCAWLLDEFGSNAYLATGIVERIQSRTYVGFPRNGVFVVIHLGVECGRP